MMAALAQLHLPLKLPPTPAFPRGSARLFFIGVTFHRDTLDLPNLHVTHIYIYIYLVRFIGLATSNGTSSHFHFP